MLKRVLLASMIIGALGSPAAFAQSANGTANGGSTANGTTTGSGGGESADGAANGTGGTSNGDVPAAAAFPSAFDEAFFIALNDANNAEIAQSRVAETRASDEEVRSYATTMVQEHTAATAALQAIATDNGRTLPTALEPAVTVSVTRLGNLSGFDFDRAYIDKMIIDHEATSRLLQAVIEQNDFAGSSGGTVPAVDSDLLTTARALLPTVQQHLVMARSLLERLDANCDMGLGITSDTTGAGSNSDGSDTFSDDSDTTWMDTNTSADDNSGTM